MLDTPGILWPKFEDQQIGYRLAAIGTIKDQILPLESITRFTLKFIQESYPQLLLERYQLTDIEADYEQIIEQIGRQRGALAPGGTIDLAKTAELFIRDFRTGKVGPITLEQPDS